MASFMSARQSQLIIFTIHGDVFIVFFRQLLDCFLYEFHSSRFTHDSSAVVGMASSSVPISLEGFRVERDLDAPLFSNANEKVTGHPKVISHRNSLAWADLELPLGWHNLSVDTADVHAGVETGTVVGLNQITGKDLSSTYLKSGE
jgi:hypothetical protein